MFSFGKPERANQQMCQSHYWVVMAFVVGGCGVDSESQPAEGGELQMGQHCDVVNWR